MKSLQLKSSTSAVLGGIAVLAACAPTMLAGDITQGFYMSSDAGVNLMTGIRSEGGEVRLNPGVRWGLEGGYGFKLADQLTLGLEAESGIIWNSLSSVRFDGMENELGGNAYQVPILANAILNWHYGKWTPYIGVGGGIDDVSANERSFANFVSGPAAGSDWGPAFQAEAGVRYALSANCELGAGYKYLAAFSQKLGDEFQDRISQVNNHTIYLSLTYHF
jgi:opacity protein-like surface antigen